MASKEAELEALLYAAGDDGLETENLLQLLEISPAALRELANHLKDRLKNDENSGLQLICINQTYKLTPLKSSISTRVIGCRYAIIDRISSAD